MTKFSLFSFLIIMACTPERFDEPIPYLYFEDFSLRLSLPENNSLIFDGGTKYLIVSPKDGKSVGVRGLIIYRKNKNNYFVYERNCSFRPNDACATVNIDISNLFMIDSCCGSTFNFNDGKPSGGAAWRPLRRYKTRLSNNILMVSSESAD